MAIVRLYAIRRLNKGQMPKRYSPRKIMMFLENYYLHELDFDMSF